MAHEIYQAAYGNVFIERKNRVPAWHGLGQKFEADEVVSLPDAAERIGADYVVEVVPEIEFYNEALFPTGNMSVWRKEHKGQKAEKFAICSDGWKPVQNMWLAETFNAASKYFPLETMGALKGGRMFFLTLKAEGFSVNVNGKDDAHESYIYVSDYKMPGKRVIVGGGSTRIVCANTHAAAMSGARFLLPLEHDKDASNVLAFMADALTKLGSAREAERQALQMLANKTLNYEDAKNVFSMAWLTPKTQAFVNAVDGITPDANKEIDLVQNAIVRSEGVSAVYDRKVANTAYMTDRVNGLRNAAMVSLKHMEDEGYGVNAYTIAEAVIETEEHRNGSRGEVAYDMIYGGRAENIQRTFNYLLEGTLDKRSAASILDAVWTGLYAGVPTN